MSSWVPDWRDENVVLIGAGPSAGSEEARAAFHRLECAATRPRVVTLNESAQLFPAADMIYACDDRWWRKTGFDWRSAPGLRVCAVGGPHTAEGVHKVELFGHDIIMDTPGRIGSGENSGFQALNLIAQTGAASVALIGLDMGGGGIVHWHGHGWPWSSPGRVLGEAVVHRWRSRLDAAAGDIAAAGLDVVNCSPISALTAFRREPLGRVLDRWIKED